jgi:ubiquinone/menaquinone biosynthesis C-methylase UbiE
VEIRKSDYENYDYREFWKDNQRFYEDSSERIALKNLFDGVKEDEKLFIDLGCGFARLFNEYKNFQRIILVDYSINNLKVARENIKNYLSSQGKSLDNIIFVAADAENLPFKENCSDIIFTIRVLHHLGNPENYFNEVARVLRNNGIFFLEFANKRNFKNILKFFIGKMKTSPFSFEPLKIGDTILNYHPKFIIKILRDRGFRIKKRISVSNFRINFFKKNINPAVLLFFEKLYQKLFSFTFLGPSIFLKSVITKNMAEEEDFSSDNNYFEYFKSILVCPICKKKLIKKSIEEGNLSCSSCGKTYEITDGIFNFRI